MIYTTQEPIHASEHATAVNAIDFFQTCTANGLSQQVTHPRNRRIPSQSCSPKNFSLLHEERKKRQVEEERTKLSGGREQEGETERH